MPHAITVTTADVTERKGAWLALGRCAADLQAVQRVLANGGYVGQPFAQAVGKPLGAKVQIAKRSELHTFAVMPQRWILNDPSHGGHELIAENVIAIFIEFKYSLARRIAKVLSA